MAALSYGVPSPISNDEEEEERRCTVRIFNYSRLCVKPENDCVTEMLSQNGLEAKILASASVSASKIWPRPGLGLQQKNKQQSVCTFLCRLHRTSHYDGR